jgi:hypothetical protein
MQHQLNHLPALSAIQLEEIDEKSEELTRAPHFFSAHRTYFPNLKRVRHSSTLNSKTSLSSFAEERQRRFCWNKAIIAIRTVRGFSDVDWTI